MPLPFTVTTTVFVKEVQLPKPVQVSVYGVVDVGASGTVHVLVPPLVVSSDAGTKLPFRPQETAFVQSHESVVWAGGVMSAGFDVKSEQETTGGAPTVMVVDVETLPPGPVQVKEYDGFGLLGGGVGLIVAPPAGLFVNEGPLPLQSPSGGVADSVHAVVFADNHVAVTGLP
jgi:hypothetical protein